MYHEMPLLNANIRAFNLYAESLKLYNCDLWFIPRDCLELAEMKITSQTQEGCHEGQGMLSGMEQSKEDPLDMRIFVG